MSMCEGPTEYPYTSTYTDKIKYSMNRDLPVIAQGISVPDRPRCNPGEHGYEIVGEDGFNLLTGPRERLVLYCRNCGDVIVHSLDEDHAHTS